MQVQYYWHVKTRKNQKAKLWKCGNCQPKNCGKWVIWWKVMNEVVFLLSLLFAILHAFVLFLQLCFLHLLWFAILNPSLIIQSLLGTGWNYNFFFQNCLRCSSVDTLIHIFLCFNRCIDHNHFVLLQLTLPSIFSLLLWQVHNNFCLNQSEQCGSPMNKKLNPSESCSFWHQMVEQAKCIYLQHQMASAQVTMNDAHPWKCQILWHWCRHSHKNIQDKHPPTIVWKSANILQIQPHCWKFMGSTRIVALTQSHK